MKSITPSKVKGDIAAPPSKSMTVRALAAGLLTNGAATIRNVSLCDDGLTGAAIVEALGAAVIREGKTCAIKGVGRQLLRPPAGIVDCCESGLAMRMFAPIVAHSRNATMLAASGSLGTRPMAMLSALEQLGAHISTDDGHAPVVVRGPIKGGPIDVDASVSSQFLTGLLMSLPLCDASSSIVARDLKSTPYVRMTLQLLRAFGIRIDHDHGLREFSIEGGQSYIPSEYLVEGDWSGASFLLVAAATAGQVTVTGLDPRSFQADRVILEALEMAGAVMEMGDESVSVRRENLVPFRFDATACPDLFPPLVALGSTCPGTSVIYGADRLAYKESDRAATLMTEFGKLGVDIRMAGGRMEVHGGKIRGGVVDAHGDHRIAMACAVAALTAQGGVSIQGSSCVAKSYPDFFSNIEQLRVAS